MSKTAIKSAKSATVPTENGRIAWRKIVRNLTIAGLEELARNYESELAELLASHELVTSEISRRDVRAGNAT